MKGLERISIDGDVSDSVKRKIKRLVPEAQLTASGAILGTPAYMAPEQARGEKVDHRADLFSLGATLYRAATGRLPFDGTTPLAVVIALTTEEPTPVRDLAPGLPPALADLHLLSHTIYKQDELARSLATQKHRERNPAANASP